MSTQLHFDRFTFDPSTRELSAAGARIRLEPQPGKLLALLVARAGSVVSRAELQRELWAEGTYVDHEQGINYCVASLRRALGDTADAPRFIETLPKRGYRFLVETQGSSSPPAASSAPPVAGRPQRRRWALAAGLLVLLATAAVVLASRGKATPTLAVTLVDNETGRPDLDRAAQVLTDTLVVRLAGEAAPWSVIGNAPLLRQPRPFRNLDAIATSLHADFVLLGQFIPGETGVTVLTHLIRLRDQRHVWVQRFPAAGNLDPHLTERIADEVRRAASAHIPAP